MTEYNWLVTLSSSGTSCTAKFEDGILTLTETESGEAQDFQELELTAPDNPDTFSAFYDVMRQCPVAIEGRDYIRQMYDSTGSLVWVVFTEPITEIGYGDIGGLYGVFSPDELSPRPVSTKVLYVEEPVFPPEPAHAVPLVKPCPYGLTHYGEAPFQRQLTAGPGIEISDDGVISASGSGGEALGYQNLNLFTQDFICDVFMGTYGSDQKSDVRLTIAGNGSSISAIGVPCASNVYVRMNSQDDGSAMNVVNFMAPIGFSLEGVTEEDLYRELAKVSVKQHGLISADVTGTKSDIEASATVLPMQRLDYTLLIPFISAEQRETKLRDAGTCLATAFICAELTCTVQGTKNGAAAQKDVTVLARFSSNVFAKLYGDYDDPQKAWLYIEGGNRLTDGFGSGDIYIDNTDFDFDANTVVRIEYASAAALRSISLQWNGETSFAMEG